MKLLLPSLLLYALLFLAACGGDDDEDPTACGQSDWVGTYSGTLVCDNITEDVVVTVGPGAGNTLEISYESATVTTTYTADLTFTDCVIDASSEQAGTRLELDVILRGQELELTETISNSGFSSTCVIVATRN